MEVKRIFYLDHSTDFSGGQKSLLALLSRLNRSLFYPIVIIDKKAATLESELKKINVKFIKINYFNLKRLDKLLFPLLALRLFILIRKEKCSLLHCNTFKVGLICSVLSIVIKTPVIFRSRLGILVNSHGFVDKIIYQFSDLILANSFYVKRTFFERFGDDKKIEVVYNPLFLDYTLNEAILKTLRAKYFSDSSLFYFGVIGRIEPFKRQHEIVEAVSHLSKQKQNFKIVFLGSPPVTGGAEYKNYLVKLITEFKLEKFFDFAGFVMDINEATSLLDCVILCTEGEPLSRGIFESQFLKIPVIASNSGGNLELIEDGKTGLLYELNNPHHLATKMNQILESPKLKSQMVLNGYAFVSETFNPSKTVEQEERIYLKVLEKKREA